MHFFLALEELRLLHAPSIRPKTENVRLISGYPTNPNNFGSAQIFLKPFGISKSTFRNFETIFLLFPYKKVFIKKLAYLPTLNTLEM